MQAPAFEGFFGNLFKALGGYHSAFGVVNLNTGQNFTIEYDAMYEVLNATIPFISKNPDGSTNLTWYNQGGICVQPYLNQSYYSAGFQYVTTVNGTVFNRFLDWTVGDNSTYSEYELFYSMDSWKGPTQSTIYVNSSTCYDFNWRGMQFLYSQGATIRTTDPMKHDYIVLYSAKPQQVSFQDPVWRDEIIKFYESIHLHLHAPWEQWIEFLEDLLLGNKFLYAQGQYWLIEPMHFPYIGRHYEAQPLPGQ